MGTKWGMEATLIMENVAVSGPITPAVKYGMGDAANTLLQIDKGDVTGTNVTFRGGRSATGAGCVSNYGSFRCTDCVFTDCQAAQFGGAVASRSKGSRGRLDLVRPTFSNNKCGTDMPDTWAKPCGVACWCVSNLTSDCVGCTCNVHPIYGNFYCDVPN